MIYLLVEAYQAEGMHQEALELMDRRDAVFAELATAKEYKTQRKKSERYQHSGKKIRSAYLSESGKAGYREGSWMARVPRLVAPLILLGFLCWYLGAALWKGQARQVYLVNGWNQPYTVAVNGQERALQPGTATPLQVPEGEVVLSPRDPKVALAPATCRIETPFFTRPFRSDTFVINPDRLALLVWQQAEYSEFPRPAPEPPQFHVGDLLYSFRSIDYEFSSLPPTLQMKKGQTIKKTQVALVPTLTTEARLALAGRALGEEGQKAYAQRLLDLAPSDVYAFYWVLSKLGPGEILPFLKPRLANRPVLVEWHRAYQNHMDRIHPERDLRPEYEQLVAETKRAPDALYLLARLQDFDEAERLLQQAAGAKSPSFAALYSLGFSALAQGRFGDAVVWLDKAVKRSPDHPVVQAHYESALLAAARYDQLLEQLRNRQQAGGQRLPVLTEQVRAYAAKGDKAGAQATIEEAIRTLRGQESARFEPIVRAAMNLVLCSGDNDVAGFLKWTEQIPDSHPFEPALLRGKLQTAADAVEGTNDDEAISQHALLYLAARKAGNAKLADEQWQLLLACLEKTGRYTRQLGAMLAGRQPLNPDLVLRLPMEPRQKRILLAVVAQRHPDQGNEMLQLARSLNFHLDGVSLCLRKILDE
jgi:tetratricopeptide (TPR) repeat protein